VATERETIAVRELTQKDLPFLRRAQAMWTTAFPFQLDRAQLILWLEQYDDVVFEKGLAVAASWFKRRGSSHVPEEVYAYASAAMRNVQRAHDKGKELLGPETGGAA
jgi:hypothetical protein